MLVADGHSSFRHLRENKSSAEWSRKKGEMDPAMKTGPGDKRISARFVKTLQRHGFPCVNSWQRHTTCCCLYPPIPESYRSLSRQFQVGLSGIFDREAATYAAGSLDNYIKAARDNSTLLRIENRSGVPFSTTTCLVGGQACFVRFEPPLSRPIASDETGGSQETSYP